MKNLLKLSFLVLLSNCLAMAQLENIGTLSVTNSLGWDDPNTNRTDIAGYNLFILRRQITKTNNTVTTNYVQEGQVFAPTNRISGPLVMTNNLSGWKFIYLTAVTTNEVESDPSITNMVMFRNNVPLAPRNIQLFQVVTAIATNQLPVIP